MSDFGQTLDHFRRTVDQIFGNFCGAPLERSTPNNERAAVFSPVLESGWTDDALFRRAIVPGVPDV